MSTSSCLRFFLPFAFLKYSHRETYKNNYHNFFSLMPIFASNSKLTKLSRSAAAVAMYAYDDKSLSQFQYFANARIQLIPKFARINGFFFLQSPLLHSHVENCRLFRWNRLVNTNPSVELDVMVLDCSIDDSFGNWLCDKLREIKIEARSNELPWTLKNLRKNYKLWTWIGNLKFAKFKFSFIEWSKSFKILKVW